MQNNPQSVQPTPVITVPSKASPPSPVLSTMPLSDWRGSITAFKGFTGTRPELELSDVTWDEIVQVVAPEEPTVLDDKSLGQFFIPCALKVAPLVGNTLDSASRKRQPTTGKMRSKQHVTEATMLVIDVDGVTDYGFKAGLAKISRDRLTVQFFTTHSHGSTEKPGTRARLIVPLDRPVNTEEYASAWHGFDRNYLGGKTGEADASGANLYQQQGTWCCHPDRFENARARNMQSGVASADALISLGKVALPSNAVQSGSAAKSAKNLRISPALIGRTGSGSTATTSDYPSSDANNVAAACQQIGAFRDAKGADQSEPEWFNAIGVVAHCVSGADFCQDWSSGHADYDVDKTSKKIAYRLKTPPTTCAQFQRTSPTGCHGCTQQCNSPITLGRKKKSHLNSLKWLLRSPPMMLPWRPIPKRHRNQSSRSVALLLIREQTLK